MPAYRLYLASASPRRRQLIPALGLPVTVGLAPVDEAALQAAYRGPNEQLAEYLARAKALAAAQMLAHARQSGDVEDVVVVGADTTVLLDNQVLGKPAGHAEATSMLQRLRGRRHTVVTGVAVAASRATDGATELRSERVATLVTMRPFDDQEIAAYVATDDPLDKAGSYAVQHASFQPVEAIAGCYTAVVGLPLCALAALLTGVTGAAPRPAARSAGSRCPWSERCAPPLPAFDADAGTDTLHQAR